MEDLNRLDYGMVLDMFVESGNDGEKYSELANQADFDRF